jgi:nitrate reductase gamma subunit
VFLSSFTLFAPGLFAEEKYVELTKKNCVECHTDRYYFANDFFLAETFSKWYYHMWAFSIAAFLFLAGLIWRIYIWNMGEGSLVKDLKEIKKERLFNFFIFEVFFQKKIYKTDKVRWFIFVSESMGFITLFSIFMFMALVKFYLKIGWFVNGPGGLALDFMLDALGLLILVGTVVSFVRRMKKKDEIINERKDIAAVVLLFTIVLTGFIMEAFKFAMLPISVDAAFSFVGFAMSLPLRPFDLPWVDFRYYLWIFHATIAFVFLAYIPYSKIMHAIACPVSIVTSASDPQS